MAANRTPILDPRNYQIAWIAPLHIEAEAALLMLDATHEGDFYTERGDDYIYFAGAINGHNVIIATFPADQEYGVGSAAALASQVKKRFPNLWFGLLVGVAAGLPNLDRVPPLDIRLGDVLVGVGDSGTAGLINYGLGKQTKDGFELIRHGYLARTIKIVGAAISALKLKDRHLNTQGKPPTFLQYYEHVRDKLDEDGTFADPGQEKDNLHRTVYDSSDPATGSELVERTKRPHNVRNRIWYGPIGSGDTLMRDAKKRDELRDKHEVIGLEMEAAGIGNIIPVGVIRGVCDYGDDQKNDIWQPYAAAMAAAYAKAVLYQIRVRPDRRGEDPGNIAEASGASVGLQPNQGTGNNIEHQSLPSTLPNYSNHMFSGREAELTWIEETLKKSSTLDQRVCLYGLGSIGKTEIAFQYAKKCSSERSTFWIRADTAENLELGYAAIGHKLIPNFGPEKGKLFAVVKEYLERPGTHPWLMVLDGADTTELFFDKPNSSNHLQYIPRTSQGQILITSRVDGLHLVAWGQFVSPGRSLQIKPMSISDGTVLFQRLIDHEPQVLGPQILAPQGLRFLDMLGGLPLAIIQATTYMLHEGVSIQDFIELYKKIEGHERIFQNPAMDIDSQVVSVLCTWEISYRKIAETSTPGSKSQAAMLLDLLGFIDSKSSILRSLSEAELIFKDAENNNPMDGLREVSEMQPALETMFAAQSTPRAELFRVFINKFTPSSLFDFKSATKKLQRYSLIDDLDCWVPPVVHGWISRRMEPEERCKYIKWLVEDLWQQIIPPDYEFVTRWEDNLLPPKYHELVLHELPQLRHARVLLDHASSRTVLDSMTQGNSLAHEAVDLLYRLGRMLGSAGRIKDGIYYLEKSIECMESLKPGFPAASIYERRLQLAKTRFRLGDLAYSVAEAKSLADVDHSCEAALWLAQCRQIAGELQEASVIFQEIISALPNQLWNDPNVTRIRFAASLGQATTLCMISGETNKIEARRIIDDYLIPFLQGLNDGDTLKVLLYREILISRLEVTADPVDQQKIVQNYMTFDDTIDEGSMTGGKQLEWRVTIDGLRLQKKWSVIAALGEAFVARRRSFIELWNMRWHINDQAQFDRLILEIDSWIVILYRLGTAYSELEEHDNAEKSHWAALGLCLGLGLFPPSPVERPPPHVEPPHVETRLYQANLWRLNVTLVSQQKDREQQILSSFFEYHIEKEIKRREEEDLTRGQMLSLMGPPSNFTHTS